MPPYQKRVTIVGLVALAIIALLVFAGKLVERRLLQTGQLAPKPSERVDTDGTGQKVTTRAFEGEVLSWDPDKGILNVREEGAAREVAVTFPITMLFLATSGGAKTGGNMTLVKDRNDPLGIYLTTLRTLSAGLGEKKLCTKLTNSTTGQSVQCGGLIEVVPTLTPTPTLTKTPSPPLTPFSPIPSSLFL